MTPRKPRPRQSRLSLQALSNQLKKQNEEFREALETIADVLEDVGILEPEEPTVEEYLEDTEEPEVIEPLPPKQSEE